MESVCRRVYIEPLASILVAPPSGVVQRLHGLKENINFNIIGLALMNSMDPEKLYQGPVNFSISVN